ncbi:GTPase [Acidihalobacter prosperus]|uniref:G domain-containing protein n=1 Tax=Acidihalobacter prosperus TaxID=160660 RepID=A0A1A6C6L3_9GAMM|nr:GTPase [Acidihalobacter prosperus]OBS10197.1 hypothetical protein Thpro_021247 [Acidihalobacter prosperus]
MNLTPRLRQLLALGLLLVLLLALLLSLAITDLALRVWQRLSALPPWVYVTYGVLLVVFLGAGFWLLYRLLRSPRRASADLSDAPLDETGLEARLQAAEARGIDVAAARSELAELGARRATGHLYVALFGEVSVGKSSLIRALIPGAEAEVGVEAGVTREVRHYRWQSPAGDALVLADVPGTGEVGGELDELAAEEARRAQLVVYVTDGDLTRSQQTALERLAALRKPLLLALNKSDRYGAAELETVAARLRERLAAAGVAAPVVAVSAGAQREVLRALPDGGETRELRTAPPEVEALRDALQRAVDGDPQLLERLRDGAIFALAAERLAVAERDWRRQAADRVIRSSSRKAALAALATVAPGADVLVQGYIGTALVRELCELYEIPVQTIDIQQFLKSVQTRVGRVMPLVLSVVGNGLKAFPGLGTVVGGVVQAIAYGLIFDALGRALARTLETRGRLNQTAVDQAFREVLGEDLEARARRLAEWLVKNQRGRGD